MFCAKDCPDTCEFNAWIEGENLKIQPKGWDFLKKPFVCRKLSDFYKREILDNNAESMVNGKRVSVDTALKEFANFLKSSKDKKILYYRGSGNLGYAMFGWDCVFSKFDNVYFVDGSPCDETGIEAHIEDFGCCVNPDIKQIEKADAVVIFGKNAFAVSPHLYMYLKILNKPIVYIDPIRTETAKLGKFIRINPAADGSLAYALIDALGYENLADSESAFYKTGLRYEEFEYLVELFKNNKNIAIIEGYGLQRYRNGKNSIQWINRLAYLSGNLDFLFYSRSSKEGLKKPNISPRNRVFISDIADLLKDNFFDAFIVVASNPVMSLPDADIWQKALESKFFVSIDTSLTESSSLADIFIKVSGMFAQKDIQGSYFFDKTLKKEPLVKGISDLDAAKRVAKLLDFEIDVNLNDIFTSKKPTRRVNFREIGLKEPFNEQGKVRFLSIAKGDYLNSQGKHLNDETVYLSKEIASNLDIKEGETVYVVNNEKSETFVASITDKVKGNIALVYKSRSPKTNRIFKSIPTDTKRAIAYNDTFVEIKKEGH